MECAISGEPANEPVVNVKSGRIYEKKLIISYLQQHGQDPVTHTQSSPDDLVDIVPSHRSAIPVSSSLTSIPSLLSALQAEWDATALEVFNLRQELTQTKKQLSTALYRVDAATRVAARLSEERDAAREALTKLASSISAGDAMIADDNDASTAQVKKRKNSERNEEYMPANGPEGVVFAVERPMSQSIVEKITSLGKELTQKRKQKAKPQASVLSFKKTESLSKSFISRDSIMPGSKVDLKSGRHSLSALYYLKGEKTPARNVIQFLDVDSSATVFCQNTSYQTWNPSGEELAVGLDNGNINLYTLDMLRDSSNDDVAGQISLGEETTLITCLDFHPVGLIYATAGNRWIIGSFEQNSIIMEGKCSSEIKTLSIHPDGLLFALSTFEDNKIYILNSVTGQNMAVLDGEGNILSFSENGRFLAAGTQTSVDIWDLGKIEKKASIECMKQPRTVEFDKSGNYLLVVEGDRLTVLKYASKQFSTVLVISDGVENAVFYKQEAVEAPKIAVLSHSMVIDLYEAE